MAWEITRDLYSNPKNRPKNLVGPQLIRFDNWRSQAWDLITHAGFLTYPHHDANGLCTYTFTQCGMKIWGSLQFKDGTANTARHDLININEKMVAEHDAYKKVSDTFNIYLYPRDLL
jgi:hypothetical protein